MSTKPTLVRKVIARQANAIEEAIGSSDEEMARKIEAVRRACRSAITMIGMRPDREDVLNYRDPVPPSTIEALERLRRSRPRSPATEEPRDG